MELFWMFLTLSERKSSCPVEKMMPVWAKGQLPFHRSCKTAAALLLNNSEVGAFHAGRSSMFMYYIPAEKQPRLLHI
jgi:hypothetical protein